MKRCRLENTPDHKPCLIAILGPTGVGKTEMALKLARECNGEIISADSMQVYRMMDIGTAKPSPEERSMVRHHLIDVVNPDESFDAAMFVSMAGKIITELQREGKNVFVVGGTGLYIKALLGGLFDGPGADKRIRESYRQELKCYGKAHLYNKLKDRDEQAAVKIDANDTVRIIRALEVLELSGESIVKKQMMHGFSDTRYECLKIGLTMDRDHLYDRIDQRTDKMIREGLVEEVQGLLDRGYHEKLKPMQSLGYRHIVNYLKRSSLLEEAIKMMKRDTRHYAKRQITWFRADNEIRWISHLDMDSVRRQIESFLSY